MNPQTNETVDRYTKAWNRHDVDAILSLHTDDCVFENHTSGGSAIGKAELRKLVESIFDTFPDLEFSTRRAYVAESFAALEWTARATHTKPIARGPQVFGPTGKLLAWKRNGCDADTRGPHWPKRRLRRFHFVPSTNWPFPALSGPRKWLRSASGESRTLAP